MDYEDLQLNWIKLIEINSIKSNRKKYKKK